MENRGPSQRDILLTLDDALRGDDGVLVRLARLEERMDSQEAQNKSEQRRMWWVVGGMCSAGLAVFLLVEQWLLGRV